VKADPAWQFEGEVFHVLQPNPLGECVAGKQPVYRLYNNSLSGAPNHRYTKSLAVREAMITKGWIPEGAGQLGVGMCV
jgi:hypothetical protein